MDFNGLQLTFEEWEALVEAKRMGKTKGIKVLVDMYSQRCQQILENDELLPFETAEEISYQEFLQLKQERSKKG